MKLEADLFYCRVLYFLIILGTLESVPEIPFTLLSFYFSFSKYLCIEVF